MTVKKTPLPPTALLLQRLMLLAIGCLISAIAANGYIRPMHLLGGGATGIAIVVNYLTHLNIGLVVLLINIPLFVLAWFSLPREFVWYSIFCMLLFSFLLDKTTGIERWIGVQDTLLSAIIGGVLNGVGMAVIFRSHGSVGGMDIIASLVRKKWDIPLGNAMMAANLIIIAWGGYVFGRESFYYTLLVLFISYQCLDKMQSSFETKKSVFIITGEFHTIGDALMKEMNRAITYISAEGGWSGKDQKIIYTIVNPSEIPKIRNLVNRYDPDAFLSVFATSEVRGYRFSQRFI